MPMKVRYTTVDGEVIAENRNGVRKQYVPDPLGSTVALLDSTATVTDTFSYWPYGEVASRTGTTPTPLQFVGTRGYYSDSTSRSYVRARHLDFARGRWTTEDPINYYGGDWNLYRYVLNSPTGNSDFFGLWCTKILGKCYGSTCNQRSDCPKNQPPKCPTLPDCIRKPLSDPGSSLIINAIQQIISIVKSGKIGDLGGGIFGPILALGCNGQDAVNTCKQDAIQIGDPDTNQSEKGVLCLECCHALLDAAGQGGASDLCYRACGKF